MRRINRRTGIALCAAAAVVAGWPRPAPAQQEPQSELQPSSPPPSEPPPPPESPVATAPPPPEESAPPPAAQPPPGQWVYTQQYGWVFEPYGQSYSYAPPDGVGEPQVYVYTPSYGWRWVVAPWVWGIGPWPYFGVHGPGFFFWYRTGWWRTPHRWHYRPAPVRPGFERGFRPGPPPPRHLERGGHERFERGGRGDRR